MKPCPLVAVLGVLIYFLPASAMQMQPSQQKMEGQGELKLGETQTRTLAPDAIHVWDMNLEAGQYIVVEVEQKSIDVAIQVVDSKDVQKNEFHNPLKILGTEQANWVANTAGRWKVRIVSLQASQAGEYEIKWTIRRQAVAVDGQIAVADSLHNLARDHHEQGKYAEAELLYRQALEIKEKLHGTIHPEVASVLSDLATLYWERGKYAEAEPLFKRSLAILEKALGPEHPETASILANLGVLYKSKSDFAKADSLYKKALAILKKNLGPSQIEVALILNNLGVLYEQRGKYKEVEPLYQESLSIFAKVLGPTHPLAINILSNLAYLYRTQGQYDKAEPLYKHTLEMQEKTLGADHPDVATSLNHLASLYDDQGKYTAAEPLFRRALTIREKAFGREHYLVAMNLNNLARPYRAQAKYAKAESLYIESIEIYKTTLGGSHPHFTNSIESLGLLYSEQGRYTEAEPLLKQSLAIREKTLGPEHSAVAVSLNGLAVIYKSQGRYAEAIPLYQRSLNIREKSLGSSHPAVATVLTNLANIYTDQRNYAEAELLYERALTIREKALGLDHPDVANSLYNIGTLRVDQGKHAEAESLYTRALTIWEKTFGPEHPDIAASFNLMAQCQFLQGEEKLEGALAFIQRAIKIWDNTLASPERRANAYALRARIYQQKGNSKEALSDLTEALRSIDGLRPQIGGGGETKAGFFEKYSDQFNRMTAWQLEVGQLEKALEYAERGRARVLLDQFAAGKIDLHQSIAAEIRAPLEQRETNAKARLAEYQQRINRLRSRKDLSDKEKTKQIAALQDTLRMADRDYQEVYEEIKNASPLWRDLLTSNGQPVSLAAIQNELVPQNALMLLYQIGKENSHLFVIPPSAQKPEVIALQVSDKDTSILEVTAGPLKSTDLQKILADSSAGLLRYLKTNPNLLQSGQEKLATTKLQALWHMLMPDSIWPRVKACAEVIVIPDGLLHQLPFETLVVQSGASSSDTRYWLDEGPVIRYAPSATILYSLEKRQIEKSPAQPSILSLSDPIFDLEMVGKEMQKHIASRAATLQDSTTAQSSGLVETLLAETRSKERELAGPLPKLPGTGFETDYIRQYFGVKNVKALQQLQADEPHLRANIQGKRYIHLATHGLVELQHSSLSNSLALTPPPKDTVNAENDGFLKLYEIYELKLPACELAVLSACETHFGRLFEGEGVFALSRGFLAAGAARVVASHWQVQDISTAELVGAFFRSVANAEKNGKPVDYAQALRDAKLKLRRDKNRRQWAAPYFWAPFIITGKK